MTLSDSVAGPKQDATIVLVIRQLAPYWAEAMDALAEAWAPRGEVIIVSGASGEDELHPWAKNASLLRRAKLQIIPAQTHRRWLGTAWPPSSIWHELTKLNPAIVIIHEYSPYVVFSGLLWAKATYRPCIVTSDVGPMQRRQLGPTQRLVHSAVNSAVEGILARTQDALSQARISQASALFSPHAVQTRLYDATERAPKGGQEAVRFIQVGSLIPRKGFDLLLRAFQKTRETHPNFELVFVGSGDHAAARSTAKALGISEHVHIQNFLQPAELAKEYARSDIFVLASRFDSYGVVVHEAAAAGLPLVVSKYAGAASTLVEDDVNGFLVDPHDCEAFSAALMKAADPAHYSRYSNASRQIAQKYDVKSVAYQSASWIAQIASCYAPRELSPKHISWRHGLWRLGISVLEGQLRSFEDILAADAFKSHHREIVVLNRYIPFYREAIFKRIAAWRSLRLLYSGKTLGNLRSVEGVDASVIPSLEIPWKGQRAIFWLEPTIQLIATKPQVVYTEFSLLLFSTWMLFLLRPILGFRLVFWTHGLQHYGWRGKKLDLKDRLRLVWLRWADAVVFYSEDRKRDVVEVTGDKEKYFVAPNALDTITYHRIYDDLSKMGRDKLRAQLGIVRPTLVYLGRLVSEKEVLRLPEILYLTAGAAHPPDLIIIGSGPLEPTLKQQCMPYGARVRFLGPIYDAKELGKYMFCADLMITLGYVGLNVVDSLAMGCSVATLEDGVLAKRHSPEVSYLKDGENAIFSSTVESLAFKICHWLDRRPAAPDQREKIRRDFLEACSIKNQFSGLRDSFDYVMNRSPKESISERKQPGILSAVVITAIGVAAFGFLDQAIYRQVTFAALSGTLLLFGLALRFPPKAVIASFALLLPWVTISITLTPNYNLFDPASAIRIIVRSLTFCVAGILATMASLFRSQLREMLNQTRDFLVELPVAVLFSNASGRVTWANKAAKQVLGSGTPEGQLYLEVLPSDGTPIDYSLLFSSSASEAFVRKAVPDYKLHFIRIGHGRRVLLATILFSKSSHAREGA